METRRLRFVCSFPRGCVATVAEELRRRIELLRSLRATSRREVGAASVTAVRSGALEAELAAHGWRMIAPLVARRVRADPLRIGTAAVPELLIGASVSREQIVYFDTETTGLSGGAGTTVFLVGTGRHIGDSFEVVQTLLVDFPGEAAFLDAVAEQMGCGEVWVSYNGRAFDQRLLESRFLFAGKQPPSARHLDLLYWTRRLWKSILPTCALCDVEAGVLHMRRQIDIPGAEIPDRYFAFLRSGRASLLTDVVEHHRYDIVTLARLLGHLSAVLSDPLAGWTVDRVQLGRFLLAAGDRRGEAVLRRVVDRGEPRERERAGLFLALILRRQGRREEAAVLWYLLYTEGSVAAGIELAKHYEHRSGDRHAALSVVESLLRRTDHACHGELEHRRSRLVRLLGGGDGAGVQSGVF